MKSKYGHEMSYKRKQSAFLTDAFAHQQKLLIIWVSVDHRTLDRYTLGNSAHAIAHAHAPTHVHAISVPVRVLTTTRLAQ